MDSLWGVADQVFTKSEVDRFTLGEAFVLGCTFYVHDLAMSIGATEAGREQLETSEEYLACVRRLTKLGASDSTAIKQIALRVSARDTHAKNAERFLDGPLPGIDRWLIENTEIREQWGDFIAKVAASHHWSMRKVDSVLGVRGLVPDSIGGTVDLAFLACALRIVDYAHINAMRAGPLDRALRSAMSEDSLIHWYAQERIAGPSRQGDLLVYASMRPIRDVSAWWIFYEMASGLDREITAVAEYLANRTVSAGRFSLEGVRGVKSPQTFSTNVLPDRFAPVDVRFRPDSTSRLVGILGGRTLYGKDQFAAIRELLQNARDAIHLRAAAEAVVGASSGQGEIRIELIRNEPGWQLAFTDDGIGMNERIISTYLLGIAADYWNSADFFADFGSASVSGFRPVGRFGIGFLSVFMLGEDVDVQTQRRNGSSILLRLRGVGRRGTLEVRPSGLRPGTTVSIALSSEVGAKLEGLARIVQAKAPMLDIRATIVEGGASSSVEIGWWKTASQDELSQFVQDRDLVATTPLRQIEATERDQHPDRYLVHRRRTVQLRNSPALSRWPGDQPELVTDKQRIYAHPGSAGVILCSKGFAVSTLRVGGLVGICDVGDVELNAARSLPLEFDSSAFRRSLLAEIWPNLVSATNGLAKEGMVPTRFAFLHSIAQSYGTALLRETSLPWITVMESPGNAILLSPNDFKKRVAEGGEVAITYGSGGGPWQCDSFVRGYATAATASTLRVPVSSVSGPEVGSHRDEQHTIEGALADHFVGAYGPESRLTDATLLSATLELIGEALGLSDAQVHAQSWIRVRQTLVGHLRRPSVGR